MLEKINQSVAFIREKTNFSPEVGIILGTGLGGLVREINIEHSLNYQDIPHFPVSTVEGHQGRLIFGTLAGKKVMAMQGRFHYYEGYTMQEVTFPVRVMKFLGIKQLIVSNASGGVNPNFEIGDIMIITDHINLMPNPLIGKNYDELGPRFPDMSDAYDKNLVEKAENIAHKLGVKVQKGTYVGVTGPTLETPSEYVYFRTIGGDTVGMSTVPEVIIARHMHLPCFAISIITDLGVPGKIVKVTHEEVQHIASQSEPKMTQIIKSLVGEL
ncbi:MAG: purine-nucleoside phosphorylase [Bacteroidales bacterium]